MQSEKDKAEQFVRSKLPELMELSFGCEVIIDGVKRTIDEDRGSFLTLIHDENGYDRSEVTEIIGHPIQPHHWLQALVEATYDGNWMLNYKKELVNVKNFGNRHFKNNYLIIGTERFYKAFNDIVGI